jgi:UDP-glucose 4-epimerase
VVLVTGAAGPLGGAVARTLSADPAVRRVIGVDTALPACSIGTAEFVRADVRDLAMGRIVGANGVGVVVHAHLGPCPPSGQGRVTARETHVLGTMQLLAACQRSPDVRRLVVASTAAVYGSSPRDPALFAEGTGAKEPPTAGWGEDAVEVEAYVRHFSRRRPDVGVITLRLADVVGPTTGRPLLEHLTLPTVPTVLGFDPRLQFLHEEDAVEALRRAALGTTTGTVNVAGSGVLLWSQVIRMAGRAPLPVPRPLTPVVRRVLHGSGRGDLSAEQVRHLCHGRVLDTSRTVAMLGWEPRWTSREAVADLVGSRGVAGPFGAGTLRRVEAGVLAVARTARAGAGILR